MKLIDFDIFERLGLANHFKFMKESSKASKVYFASSIVMQRGG